MAILPSLKIRYNSGQKYNNPFEVVISKHICVYKNNCDPQYALDKFEWVDEVLESFHSREEAQIFLDSLKDLEVI